MREVGFANVLPLIGGRTGGHLTPVGRRRLGIVRRKSLTGPETRWITAVVAIALMLAACTGEDVPTGAQLRDTIPATVGAVTLSPKDLSDIMSGLVVDDAIAALGKGRDDASVAGGSSTAGEVDLIAVAVAGVTGPQLADAIAANWLPMTPAGMVAFGEKTARVLVGPSPLRAYVYQRGPVVYVITTADEGLAAAAIAALP